MRAIGFCVGTEIDERNVWKNDVFWRKMSKIGFCDKIFLQCCRTLKLRGWFRLHPELQFEYSGKFVPVTKNSHDHKTCLSRICPLNGTLFWSNCKRSHELHHDRKSIKSTIHVPCRLPKHHAKNRLKIDPVLTKLESFKKFDVIYPILLFVWEHSALVLKFTVSKCPIQWPFLERSENHGLS